MCKQNSRNFLNFYGMYLYECCANRLSISSLKIGTEAAAFVLMDGGCSLGNNIISPLKPSLANHSKEKKNAPGNRCEP